MENKRIATVKLPQKWSSVGQIKGKNLLEKGYTPIKVSVKVDKPIEINKAPAAKPMSTFFWGVRRSENIIAAEQRGQGITKAYRRFDDC